MCLLSRQFALSFLFPRDTHVDGQADIRKLIYIQIYTYIYVYMYILTYRRTHTPYTGGMDQAARMRFLETSAFLSLEVSADSGERERGSGQKRQTEKTLHFLPAGCSDWWHVSFSMKKASKMEGLIFSGYGQTPRVTGMPSGQTSVRTSGGKEEQKRKEKRAKKPLGLRPSFLSVVRKRKERRISCSCLLSHRVKCTYTTHSHVYLNL